jgi:N-acyl-D-amino-acid deacylase
MLDLSLEEDLGTRFHVPMTNDNESQIAEMLNNDHLLLGLSDAGAHTSQLCDADFATYLLQYWWREKRTISLEKAIWRLTRQPADFLGLANRGRLETGAVADVVVFDPATVGTTALERWHDLPAGADRLVAKSTGVLHVWVSGESTRRDGQDLPSAGAGKVIRSEPAATRRVI